MYKPVKTNTNLMNQQECIATSSKYKVIPTQEIVNRFEAQGFTTSAYQESNFRKEEKRDKVKHFVRMACDINNGLAREIVIMNSYDSSSSLKLNFGAFRMVCNNQLVFGDSLLPEMRIKHTKVNPFHSIDEYIDSVRNILEQEAIIRKKMEHTRFSAYDIQQFAYKAAQIREPDMEPILDANDLSTIQRKEDIGKDLWKTFNVCQENLIQGNYRKLGQQTLPDSDKPIFKYKSAKKLTSPSKLLIVNKELHELAMSYL